MKDYRYIMVKIKIKVVHTPSSELCECNYVQDDSWVFDGATLPGGICIGAMSALLPWITCIKYDASMPWTERGRINVCCTDPDHPVTFEIKLLDEN